MPANLTNNSIFMFNNSTITHVAGDQVNYNYSFQSSIRTTRFSTPRRQHHRSARGPTGNNAEHAAIDQSHVHKSGVSIYAQPSKQGFEASRAQPQNSEVSDPPSNSLLPLSWNNFLSAVAPEPHSSTAVESFSRVSPQTPTPGYNSNQHPTVSQISGDPGTPSKSVQSYPTLTADAPCGRGNEVQMNVSQAALVPEITQEQCNIGDGHGGNICPWIAPSSTSPSRNFPTESYHSQQNFYSHYEQNPNRAVSVQQAASTRAHVDTPSTPSNPSATDTRHAVALDYHHLTETASGLQYLMRLQAIAQMISTKRACTDV